MNLFLFLQRNGEVCLWKSVDITDDNEGIEKKFRSTFESSTQADSFQDLFSKITLEVMPLISTQLVFILCYLILHFLLIRTTLLVYPMQIVERTYDYVEEQED